MTYYRLLWYYRFLSWAIDWLVSVIFDWKIEKNDNFGSTLNLELKRGINSTLILGNLFIKFWIRVTNNGSSSDIWLTYFNLTSNRQHGLQFVPYCPSYFQVTLRRPKHQWVMKSSRDGLSEFLNYPEEIWKYVKNILMVPFCSLIHLTCTCFGLILWKSSRTLLIIRFDKSHQIFQSWGRNWVISRTLKHIFYFAKSSFPGKGEL